MAFIYAFRNRNLVNSGRKCRIENLERREMMDAALGSFLRTGGQTVAVADALVMTPPPPVFDRQTDNGEVLSNASATAESDDEFGFGFEHRDATAVVVTPIGSSVAVPQTTTAGTYEAIASGVAQVGFNQFSGGQAQGSFTYNAPNTSENLVFHGHLFVSAFGGSAFSEFAGAGFGEALVAGINGARINVAGGIGVVRDVPGVEDFNFQWDEGLNLHIHFTVAISDLASFQFASTANGSTGANSTAEGESAQSLWNIATATWGYVTPAGEDLQDGDFNGDGNVDGADFDVWDDGNPQADEDEDEDGDIDLDDLRIWIANTSTQDLPGDFNGDASVDAADYTVWRDTLGQSVATAGDGADADGDGSVDEGDYVIWKTNFGATGSGSAANTFGTERYQLADRFAVSIASESTARIARSTATGGNTTLTDFRSTERLLACLESNESESIISQTDFKFQDLSHRDAENYARSYDGVFDLLGQGAFRDLPYSD